VHLYNEIKAGRGGNMTPRTFVFGGKAAPGYHTAKLIIKMVNAVGSVVNHDPDTRGLLRVVYLEDYRVSLAEKIFPASDLSEQISTAGTEASGTGNMKFALNGALTIGTLDGANIEIRDAVGKENFFLFGLTAEEVQTRKDAGYDPAAAAESDPALSAVLELLRAGHFSPEDPGLFRGFLEGLSLHDEYMLFADFASYVERQREVSERYRDPEWWTRAAILNVARMGGFSSDRTIAEYNRDVWKTQPVPIALPASEG
jgi:starch phosphorylase